ncbi:MAG: tyrosine-protein phosphatase [Ardenticatenaceae bacterium]
MSYMNQRVRKGLWRGLGLMMRRFLPQSKVQYAPPETLVIAPDVDLLVARQENDDLLVRWFVECASVGVYVGTQPDAIERGSPLAEVSGQSELLISGLDPAVRHYFELRFEGGECDGKGIVVSERFLPLQGATNFRDLGGYRTIDGRRVAWGRVYRSSQLSALSDKDLKYLLNLGLKQVCDLRTMREVALQPDRLPEELGYLHSPVHRAEEFPIRQRDVLFKRDRLREAWTKMYIDLLIDQKAQAFGNLLRRFADAEQLPIVFHCTAGKDRAGITSALLLLALGVPEEVVVADYSLSNLHYAQLSQKVQQRLPQIGWVGISIDQFQPFLEANPATLRATLAHIRTKYGSVLAYLHHAAALDHEVIARLKDNLLV